MEGLTGRHHIDAGRRERGGFSGAINAGKEWIVSKLLLARGSHLGIRLDPDDLVAVTKEHFGEQASARADIGHHGSGRQNAGGGQVIDDG